MHPLKSEVRSEMLDLANRINTIVHGPQRAAVEAAGEYGRKQFIQSDWYHIMLGAEVADGYESVTFHIFVDNISPSSMMSSIEANNEHYGPDRRKRLWIEQLKGSGLLSTHWCDGSDLTYADFTVEVDNLGYVDKDPARQRSEVACCKNNGAHMTVKITSLKVLESLILIQKPEVQSVDW